LKNLPAGTVLDLASPSGWALYYQTVHQKKMGFGDICRITASTERQRQIILGLIREGKWERIAHDFHFTYVAKGTSLSYVDVGDLPRKGVYIPEITTGELVFNGDGVEIYRLDQKKTQ
jgi:hypothetical protein